MLVVMRRHSWRTRLGLLAFGFGAGIALPNVVPQSPAIELRLILNEPVTRIETSAESFPNTSSNDAELRCSGDDKGLFPRLKTSPDGRLECAIPGVRKKL